MKTIKKNDPQSHYSSNATGGRSSMISAFFPIIALHSIANTWESQPIIEAIDFFCRNIPHLLRNPLVFHAFFKWCISVYNVCVVK